MKSEKSAKSINTLVADIQRFLTTHNPNKESVSDFSQILAETLLERRGGGDQSKGLRISNLGEKCDRKLWYWTNEKDKALPLEPEAELKFDYGAILEEYLLWLAEQAGHLVECKQMEVQLHGVTGHIDAIVDGCLIDVKSASGRAFAKFATHSLLDDDPFGYIVQLNGYLHAIEKHPALKIREQMGFLAINKETGELCLDIYNKQEIDFGKEINRKRGMLAEANPPARGYLPEPEGASGNLKLGVACSYCPFRNTCWSNANEGKGIRTFVYARAPTHLVRVVREPNVPEIT